MDIPDAAFSAVRFLIDLVSDSNASCLWFIFECMHATITNYSFGLSYEDRTLGIRMTGD